MEFFQLIPFMSLHLAYENEMELKLFISNKFSLSIFKH